MQQVQLFIKDTSGVYQRIDLFKDETISLTQSIQNIKDISKVFTDFTKTFTVPASKDTNKLFKHYYNFDIEGGFDARLKTDGLIKLNESEIHLEAHIDFNDDLKFSEFNKILKRLESILFEKFKINHFNIQPEYGATDSKAIIIQD